MEGEVTKVAVNALLVRDGKILLGKRKGSVGAGMLGVPGGHVEFGEHLIDSVKRELSEETGVLGTSVIFANILSSVNPSHYLHINFVVDAWEGEVVNMEPDKCEGWEWFDIENLPNGIFPPHREILKAYRKKLLLIEA